MRTRIGALVLAVVAGLAGCGIPPPEACVQEPTPVLDAQGDVFRCIAAEDCPRSSRISLCVDDAGGDVACIRCLETRCVTIAPETC
ncbi:MAG TPA: hypothetical protein VFZ09_40500 [Archangium sp.]|uniref:hypothetical protein n=1 Tax=Archangium sp. TaxID=1872627 RepID=UPI002E2FF9E1|nr:hypothetical protein [Archangium sp.]HEX5752556.1 hypothetical protein [Archangium sp.]